MILLFFLFVPTALAGEDKGECREADLRFGMSTALSGPAARLGINMRAGVQAAFSEANRNGGIDGRRLCLTALDDGYEPERTVPNIHELIDGQKVLALIGNVGTPTAVVATPIVNRMQILLFGAYTGAGILRKSPPDRYVINYRASYAEETAAMVDALIEHGKMQPHEIAFFTQRDAFGDAGFMGGLQALRKHGLVDERLIVHGRYERNTVAVESGLATILLAEPTPKAIIMVGAYAPCAAFVRHVRELQIKSMLLAVSFVGAAPLAQELGAAGEGVVVTQVVPHYESELPIVKDFQKALAAAQSEQLPSFGALEGYVAGRILLRALHNIADTPSRESIIQALEGLGSFELGIGAKLFLGPKEHQASHQIWPTIIREGRVVDFAWQELAGHE